ncbi:MAG: hypothetical protein IJM19_01155 [Ruminococcus sp.]|nr:hypothetical protein [Ruminococcus sp.]
MDDNTIDKLSSILSDEESLKQIAELAQMVMSEGSTDENKNTPDISSVMKLSAIAGAFSQKDKNTELLLALKPHLSDERQKRVDNAIKILKLTAVWNVAKESGLIDEFF